MAIQPTIDSLLENSGVFQELYDITGEQFNVPVWKRFLNDEFSSSLDWQGIKAVLSASPAASIIDYSAEKPVRTNPTISKLSGEVATFGNQYQFNKRDNRRVRDLQQFAGQFGIDATKLVDFLFPHLQRLAMGPMKSVDMLLLEGLSKGTMTVDAANNPQGVKFALDWGVTQTKVATVWSNVASSPLTDIRKVVLDAGRKGIRFIKVYMSHATFLQMISTTEFKTQYGLDVQEGNKTLKVAEIPFMNVEQVNMVFETWGLPMVEVIDEPVDIEAADGSVSTIYPFADSRVTFVTGEQLGTLKYTYAEEQINPDAIKSYAVNDNVMISTWNQGGKRFFESEFNAFPVLNAVSHMQILRTDEAA